MDRMFARIMVAAGILAGSFSYGWAQYALPSVSVSSLRGTPGHASELVSQAVMGTPLKILSRNGDWLRVETPEGYNGYVRSNTVEEMDTGRFGVWQRSPRVVVSATDQTYVYDNDSIMTPSHRVTDVVPGCILAIEGYATPYSATKVKLPDGRLGYIGNHDVTPLSEWAAMACDSAAVRLLEPAVTLMGTPYVWGGTSVKGMDCSGFTQLLFYRHGILLPRDASQQARVGKEVFLRQDGSALDYGLLDVLKPGDLLFFGNRATRKVNHVGLYMGDGMVIHCSGRVKINRLLDGPGADASLYLLSARRVEGEWVDSLSVASLPIYGLNNF